MFSYPAKHITYSQEIGRKAIHLSSLWMPLTLYYFNAPLPALIFSALLLGMFVYEYCRRQDNWLGEFVRKLTGTILREHEKSEGFKLTGATYVLLAALIVTLCFSKLIAITALSVMLVADTAAALIGRRFGTPNLFGKSWIGSLAFFTASLITIIFISYLLPHPPVFLMAGVIASLIATLVELFSKKIHIDDNLSITLAVAFVFTFIN